MNVSNNLFGQSVCVSVTTTCCSSLTIVWTNRVQQLENNELKLLVICHKLFLTIFMEFFSLE